MLQVQNPLARASATAAQRVKGPRSPAGEQHGKTLRVECCGLCSPNADRKKLVLLYKQEAQVTPSEVVEKEERRDKMFQDSTKKKTHLKQTTTLNY